ncbi:hypothetical protein EVAR_40188_1 [Eumeta japonica]|uniref:Uncharacterized protein n=1 Tax=Eumeta variegata TaxID=151549 RepID=A0A4C1XNV3_EUMVA|nr:hypothetical protein EVAR_40188_1 [Eumeta japonica]
MTQSGMEATRDLAPAHRRRAFTVTQNCTEAVLAHFEYRSGRTKGQTVSGPRPESNVDNSHFDNHLHALTKSPPQTYTDAQVFSVTGDLGKTPRLARREILFPDFMKKKWTGVGDLPLISFTGRAAAPSPTYICFVTLYYIEVERANALVDTLQQVVTDGHDNGDVE